MKFCEMCGCKTLNDSARFCEKCGHPFGCVKTGKTNRFTAKYHPKNRDELDKLLDRYYVDYSDIDVSQISDMAHLFDMSVISSIATVTNCSEFDVYCPIQTSRKMHILRCDGIGIELWDVSNVTDMSYMFKNAKTFNQPIGNWDVSNVTNMTEMFCEATSFNQPLDKWNVSNVANMRDMFRRATSFNEDNAEWYKYW